MSCLDAASPALLLRRGHRPADVDAIIDRLRWRRLPMQLHFSVGIDCRDEAAPHVQAAAQRIGKGVENLVLAFMGEITFVGP